MIWHMLVDDKNKRTIGTNIVPREFFGIPERFSVFAATGFNAVLGFYLYCGLKRVRKEDVL